MSHRAWTADVIGTLDLTLHLKFNTHSFHQNQSNEPNGSMFTSAVPDLEVMTCSVRGTHNASQMLGSRA